MKDGEKLRHRRREIPQSGIMFYWCGAFVVILQPLIVNAGNIINVAQIALLPFLRTTPNAEKQQNKRALQ